MDGHDPWEAWHAEHVYFGRLLDLLQAEVELSRGGRAPNHGLMLDVVEYLHVYGERYHHAREDVLFARLAQRRPRLGPAVERLRHEHIAIARVGETLLGYLNEAVDGFREPREEIEALAGTLLLFYRGHLQAEESQIIPLAADTLGAQDWEAAAEAVPSGFDPLFGARPRERYRELLRQVTL
jgi:hemerythrin-like domain-containing protein